MRPRWRAQSRAGPITGRPLHRPTAASPLPGGSFAQRRRLPHQAGKFLVEGLLFGQVGCPTSDTSRTLQRYSARSRCQAADGRARRHGLQTPARGWHAADERRVVELETGTFSKSLSMGMLSKFAPHRAVRGLHLSQLVQSAPEEDAATTLPLDAECPYSGNASRSINGLARVSVI